MDLWKFGRIITFLRDQKLHSAAGRKKGEREITSFSCAASPLDANADGALNPLTVVGAAQALERLNFPRTIRRKEVLSEMLGTIRGFPVSQ